MTGKPREKVAGQQALGPSWVPFPTQVPARVGVSVLGYGGQSGCSGCSPEPCWGDPGETQAEQTGSPTTCGLQQSSLGILQCRRRHCTEEGLLGRIP